jgi:uncharacterized membrane protein YdjX (TVP38/TMEM64 family)
LPEGAAVIEGSTPRWILVAALLLVGILVPFALLDREMTVWSLRWVSGEAQTPWIFVAVVALLAADVVLPVPSSLVSTAAGASLGFALGSVASIAGMTLCAQVGYLAGRRIGARIVCRIVSSNALTIASQRLEDRATTALIIMRPVPVLAEASVLMAGVLRVNPIRFFVTTFLANIGISVAYCAVGALALEWNSFVAAFAGAITVPAVAIGAVRVYDRRCRGRH